MSRRQTNHSFRSPTDQKNSSRLVAEWALFLALTFCCPSGKSAEGFRYEFVTESYSENATLLSTYVHSSGIALYTPTLGVSAPAVGLSAAVVIPEASQSAAELFGFDQETTEQASSEPESMGALFGEEQSSEGKGIWSGKISGFYQNSLAYTYPSPGHFSKFKNTLDVSTDGAFNRNVSWKAGARFVYDAIYSLSDFYPPAVKSNQGAYAWFMETYLDFGAGDWDVRLGRQNIIWGETVGGLFFADVVSGLDLREFIVQQNELIRIPQWAARAEYFKGDFYAELIWIPVMTVNEVGVPGAQFFSFPPPPPPGFGEVIEQEPDIPVSLDNSAGGLRASYLVDGWDTSVFYYTSLDRNPAYQRTITTGATPTFIYTPVHERIYQAGGTVTKDFGQVVLNAEAVYTKDRLFSVTTLSDTDGLVSQDEFQYIVGLTHVTADDTRVNAQFFQIWFPDHDAGMIPDQLESGGSIFVSTRAIHPDIQPELLWVTSFNDTDWLFRARLTWDFYEDWRAAFGVDVFDGPPTGFFGQFDDSDRVYYEVRYTF